MRGIIGAMSETYEREWPQWPWKEWGNIEADKARLEEAVHRTEARKQFEAQGPWSDVRRCGGCGGREFVRLSAEGERSLKSGRVRFWERCSDCGVRRPNSFHPAPVAVPGLLPSKGFTGGV